MSNDRHINHSSKLVISIEIPAIKSEYLIWLGEWQEGACIDSSLNAERVEEAVNGFVKWRC